MSKSKSKDKSKSKSKSTSAVKGAYLSKATEDWSENDVADWLASKDLGEYGQIFIENAISGIILQTINDAELISLGVNKLGHRKKILALTNTEISSSHNESESASRTSTSMSTKSDLLTSSSDAGLITIKAVYKAEAKRVRLPQGSNFSELKAELQSAFDLKGTKFLIYYEDLDGDRLSLANEADWNDCLEEAQKTIRITITAYSAKSKSSGSSSSSSSSSSRSRPKTSSSSVQAAFGVFDGLLQATIVIDEKAIIQYANPAVEKFTGYERSEMLGQNVKILMPEENAREHDSYVQNYINTGIAKVIGKGRNVTMMQKDGSYVPIHLQLTENSATGKRMFVGTISEAKEEKRQGSTLQMVREVLDTLVNPAVAITEKGIIQVFNKPAQQFWGYTLTDVVGRNVKMLMPDEVAEVHDSYISNYLGGGPAKIIGTGRQVSVLRKDGSLATAHLSVSERRDATSVIFTGVFTSTI